MGVWQQQCRGKSHLEDDHGAAIDKKHTAAREVIALPLGSGTGTMWLSSQSIAQEDKWPWECGAYETFCYSMGRIVPIGADVGTIRVLISAFADNANVAIMPGVRAAYDDRSRHEVISMASCPTNALAPLAHVLHGQCGGGGFCLGLLVALFSRSKPKEEKQ
jgi:hypothetical protein